MPALYSLISTRLCSPAVTLHAVKVLSASGSGASSGVAAGINWVQQQVAANASLRPAVVSLSLGGGLSRTIDTAVKNLVAAGIPAVVAAGNSAANACNTSPANVATAITVAAADSTGRHASFSNFGSCIDVYAPGVGVYSSINAADAYATWSGTSMAAPHVAGVVALMRAANPCLTPAQLAAVLASTATASVVGAPTGTTNRLVQARAAVAAAATTACASATTTTSGGSGGDTGSTTGAGTPPAPGAPVVDGGDSTPGSPGNGQGLGLGLGLGQGIGNGATNGIGNAEFPPYGLQPDERPGGGACGDLPLPPCQGANGLPSGGIESLASVANTSTSGSGSAASASEVSSLFAPGSTQAADYVVGMAAYAAAYAAAASPGAGNSTPAGALGNATAALLNAAAVLNALPPPVAAATGASSSSSASAPATGFNTAAQTEARETLLATLAGALAGGAPVSSADAASAAQAVASLASQPALLSGAAATSALDALASLASQPPASLGTAALPPLAAAVSDIVAAAAAQRVATPGSADAAASMHDAGAVLALLARTQAAALAPGASVALSASAFSLLVRADAPANASSPLFVSGLAAPNSSSTFDPLPRSLFSGLASQPAAVTTTLMTLAFDPWSAANNGSAITAVTRLLFAAAGAELSIANLSDAVTFTLPLQAAASAPTSAAAQPMCMFYDPASGVYETAGCVTMPLQRPAGHILRWANTTGLTSDADLAAAWAVAGPLTAGCGSVVLNCSTAAGRAARVEVAGGRVASCAGRTAGGVRVFTGASCALADAGNSARCAWSPDQQLFLGAGCVADTAVRCACRHLTDYAAPPRGTARLAAATPEPSAAPRGAACSAVAAVAAALAATLL